MKLPKPNKKIILTRNKQIDILVFIAIFAFLIYYFKPDLIFLDTITSGGDTGSHNYPLLYLENTLLSKGRLTGWSPGWYAGFPIFQFYFVLPFLFMVLLSNFMSIWVSFKIVTILGTFLLPVSAYIFAKILRFRDPAPIIAALLTLPFLFMEANSMWGGNIPSTLAGEFSYSLSFALTIMFLGLVYKTIRYKKWSEKRWITTSLILAGLVLCHIYTAMFAIIVPIFFFLFTEKDSGLTFTENFWKSFFVLFRIYFLAFLISAFWSIPLVFKVQYATPYHYVWNNVKVEDIFPKILIPTAILAFMGLYMGIRDDDDRAKYLIFSLAIAFLIYKTAPFVGITDIRFVPFVQFLPALLAAYFISETRLMIETKSFAVIMLIFLVLILWWVDHNITYIDFWIKWNYEGFQSKNNWNQLDSLMSYLSSLPPGRVVHEYSNSHDKFGTPRTFENIPLFTGKPTLEGLNIEAALSAPFVFVIQAEISETATCPIPGLMCGYFDIKKAEKHLEVFNVRYIVATTKKLKTAINDQTDWRFLDSFGEIEVYEVGNDRYVNVPEKKPLMFKKQWTNWKDVSLQWFKNVEYVDTPIIFTPEPDILTRKYGDYLGNTINSLEQFNSEPYDYECQVFNEKVLDDEIVFDTDCIGKPVLVKVSYFPNWKVEGASDVYLVSPAFMMVFPEQEHVRMYYGYTTLDLFSITLTIIGWVVIPVVFLRRYLVKKKSNQINEHFG